MSIQTHLMCRGGCRTKLRSTYLAMDLRATRMMHDSSRIRTCFHARLYLDQQATVRARAPLDKSWHTVRGMSIQTHLMCRGWCRLCHRSTRYGYLRATPIPRHSSKSHKPFQGCLLHNSYRTDCCHMCMYHLMCWGWRRFRSTYLAMHLRAIPMMHDSSTIHKCRRRD